MGSKTGHRPKGDIEILTHLTSTVARRQVDNARISCRQLPRKGVDVVGCSLDNYKVADSFASIIPRIAREARQSTSPWLAIRYDVVSGGAHA